MLIRIGRIEVELAVYRGFVGGDLYLDTPRFGLFAGFNDGRNYGRFHWERNVVRDGTGEITWWRFRVSYDLSRTKRETARYWQERRAAFDAECERSLAAEAAVGE